MIRKRSTWPWLCVAVALVAVDQLLKAWIRQNLALYETVPFLPGVVELTHVQNTGAAFSILSSYTWLLTLTSSVVAVVLCVLLVRNVFPHGMGKLSLALVLGGAVGNLTDRFTLGYVVDMFHLEFVNFAVFNVADMGVTVGGVLLCIYVVFFWPRSRGEGAR